MGCNSTKGTHKPRSNSFNSSAQLGPLKRHHSEMSKNQPDSNIPTMLYHHRTRLNSVNLENYKGLEPIRPIEENNALKYTKTHQRKQSYEYCNEFKNNPEMHNKVNHLKHLVNSLNRHMTLDPLSSINDTGRKERYIMWEKDQLPNGEYYWVNRGLMQITNEMIKDIQEKSMNDIVKESFVKKRIWIDHNAKGKEKELQIGEQDNPYIVISRENILDDSFNQFKTVKEMNMKLPLHIFFIDEIAHDVGGVYREWYTRLFTSFFLEDKGFFKRNTSKCLGNETILLNDSPKASLDYYEFFGLLLGKMLIDSFHLPENINRVLLKKIIGREVILEDVKYYDSEIYKSLLYILDNDMSDNKDIFFTWDIKGPSGKKETIELIANGGSILVKNNNKSLFIEKVMQVISEGRSKEKIERIRKGLFSLIPKEILNIFSIEEVDFLLSGQRTIDVNDWKNNTIYKGGYNEKDETIKFFWETLTQMTSHNLASLLLFCTGSTRVPIDGFISLKSSNKRIEKFCIDKPYEKELNRLIEAKTCFNRIYLPEYPSKSKMKEMLEKIISSDTNYFGRE